MTVHNRAGLTVKKTHAHNRNNISKKNKCMLAIVEV